MRWQVHLVWGNVTTYRHPEALALCAPPSLLRRGLSLFTSCLVRTDATFDAALLGIAHAAVDDEVRDMDAHGCEPLMRQAAWPRTHRPSYRSAAQARRPLGEGLYFTQ